MPTLAVYKTVTAILIILTGTATAGTTFYYQQVNNELKNNVSNLTGELNSSSSQIETLESRVSQLNNLLLQLQSEIDELQQQITDLTQTPRVLSTLISSGTIYLVGYTALYIPFTVQPTINTAKLNISFTATYTNQPWAILAALLNQTQYDAFLTCNCINQGNYTQTTWMSPSATNYQTTLDIPEPGNWYFAFIQQPGTGVERYITQSLTLLTNQ